MEKCSCYYVQQYYANGHWCDERQECWGTRERDECSCGGDRTKCDFYPKVREKALKKLGKDRTPTISKVYIVVVNYDTPIFINADSEAIAFSMFTTYRQGYNKVFDLAAQSMENLEQLIELYKTFYHENIDIFLEVDTTKGFYAPYIDWIGEIEDEKNI